MKGKKHWHTQIQIIQIRVVTYYSRFGNRKHPQIANKTYTNGCSILLLLLYGINLVVTIQNDSLRLVHIFARHRNLFIFLWSVVNGKLNKFFDEIGDCWRYKKKRAETNEKTLGTTRFKDKALESPFYCSRGNVQWNLFLKINKIIKSVFDR